VTGDLVERHRDRLDAAIAATADRGFWSAFSEDPRDYPAESAAAGAAAFEAYRGCSRSAAATIAGRASARRSNGLGITCPVADVDGLLPAMVAAVPVARRRASTGAVCAVLTASTSHEIAR
jgi:hypothetical protein